ncbi:hypothetical protein ACMFMF_002122 [Clarireedia jacksonii]
MPIDDPEARESFIAITTSMLSPVVTITATSDGTVYNRTIHPPPSPYTKPTPTTRSSNTALYVSWTSTAKGPHCTANCGHRCVGLFCDTPCLFGCAKFPDPDWWDVKDPHDPWGSNKRPYKSEDEKCTTTSASSCYTECLAASPTNTCTSSCSISYGCSVTDSSMLGTYTLAPYGYWTDDSFDMASDMDAAYTSSVNAEVTSLLEEWFPDDFTLTVNPTSTVTIPDVTVTVTPTPTADCSYWGDGFFYTFAINHIGGWAGQDSGAALKKQEGGCGALTEWKWHAAANGNDAYAYFNLPLLLTAGCVERAIFSAGGPKLSCIFEGVPGRGKKRRRASAARQKASYKAPSVTPTYTYSSERGRAEADICTAGLECIDSGCAAE